MKIPNFTELDGDQRAIYSGAPPGDSILVMGPPGTGKTVMAFHRASLLNELATKKGVVSAAPTVIMFSSVLATYSSDRDGVATGVPSTTMHKWAGRWFKSLTRRNPPTRPDDRWAYDWVQMLPELMEAGARSPARLHWGHVIIDEGQDFPQEMYQTLSLASRQFAPADGQFRPAMTVFADDNQRLNHSTNCSLEEIQSSLALAKDRVFRLKKNYRNTKQIAEFSRHYYVGLSSGVPDLPRRVGQTLPRVVIASKLEVVRKRIEMFAKNNPGMDIGVLCPGDSVRTKVYNSISSRLGETTSVVQTYCNADRAKNPATNLRFDKGGSVTVLNFQSAKGLEFDAVFIIDPFDSTSGAGDQYSMMRLYVMTSRAREYLELQLMNPPPDLDSRLPAKELYERIEE